MSATIHDIKTGLIIQAQRPPVTRLLFAAMAEAMEADDDEAFDIINDAASKILKRRRWRIGS
jgi:hypothetical protein